MLDVHDHSRDSAGLVYVYPVISRRSGGLSIGVNLNPNNACNWRCVYCQVPNLVRGAAPPIDLAQLRHELDFLLRDALHGDFYRRLGVAPEHRVIRDIAISGNGEATTAAEFPEVIDLIGDVVSAHGLAGRLKLVLISNGSQARRDSVQRGLRRWAALGGEMWFKLDSATADGIARINGAALGMDTVLANLTAAAAACPVWLQTCAFTWNGQPPSALECDAYLAFLEEIRARGIVLQGVLLYGLARPSLQPEADRLGRLPQTWFDDYAEAARALGVTVRVSP